MGRPPAPTSSRHRRPLAPIETQSDRYTLQAGIRTVEVRGKDILLNGYGRREDFFDRNPRYGTLG